MEQNQDLIKKWIKEVGHELPPSGMADKVLRKIAILPKQTYRPVISPLGWKMILGYIVVIGLLAIDWNPAKQTTLTYFDKVPKWNISWPTFDSIYSILPKFQLSPPFLIGIITFMLLSLFTYWLSLKKQAQNI